MKAALEALRRWAKKAQEEDRAEIDSVLKEIDQLKNLLESKSSEQTIKELALDLGRLRFEKAEALTVLETVREEYLNLKEYADELSAAVGRVR